MTNDSFEHFVDSQFDDEEPVAININTVVQRQMAWDMFPCGQVEDILKEQGFVPPTQENVELEHQDSHERLEQIEILKPFIYALGGFAGKLLFLARVGQAELSITDEEKEMGVMLYQDTARAAVAATITEMINFGILEVNAEAVDVRFLD